MSLKFFYEAALQEKDPVYVHAPETETPLELGDNNEEHFIEEIHKLSRKQKRQIKISQTVFRFPPSHD